MTRTCCVGVLACVGLGIVMTVSPHPAFAGNRIRMDRGEGLLWRLPLEMKLRKSISLRFESTPLEDVVDFLRTALKVNIVIAPSVLAEEQKLITLTLNDIDAGKALEWVMTLTGLRYSFHQGAIYIATPAKVRAVETHYFHIYNVRDLVASRARGARKGGGDDDDGDDDDDDDNGGGSSGSRNLIGLLVRLTGPENWKRAIVLGGGDDNDEETNGADDF